MTRKKNPPQADSNDKSKQAKKSPVASPSRASRAASVSEESKESEEQPLLSGNVANEDDLSLNDLGNSPVVDLTNAVNTTSRDEKRVFYIRICQMICVTEFFLFVVAEPKNPLFINWLEAMITEIIQKKCLPFVDKLNFNLKHTIKVINGDETRFNSRGYAYRGFCAPIKYEMPHGNMRRFLQVIAAQVSTMYKTVHEAFLTIAYVAGEQVQTLL